MNAIDLKYLYLHSCLYAYGCSGKYLDIYVAFRRKALFVEGVSEFVKVAGI